MAPTPDPTDDSRDLAAFGYRPVLDRTLGGLLGVRRGVLVPLGPDRRVPDVLHGLRRGRPGVLLDLAGGVPGPVDWWPSASPSWRRGIPLSGGVYQWSRRTGGRAVGWMAGLGLPVRLGHLAGRRRAGAAATLPQIAPAFQLVGDPAVKADSARNAVILGCVLIAATTAINVAGVRLLARINNVGVFAELVGRGAADRPAGAHARRGPGVLLETLGRGDGGPLGYLGPAWRRR